MNFHIEGALMTDQTAKPMPAPVLVVFIARLTTYVSEDFLGGPRPWKLSWVVNFQKSMTFIFLGVLMWMYQNFSLEAWLYLALHGSYGFVWLLKDMCFPDPKWQKKVTISGGIASFFLVLFWYWVIGWVLISRVVSPEYPLHEFVWYCLCISLCILGCVLMIAADAQKFYTLRLKKALISDGLYRYIRHPNYLGEMMIYASFALLVWHWLPAVILATWKTLYRKQVHPTHLL